MNVSRQEALRELREADETLGTCFERAATIHRQRTAIISDNWQPTYAELNETVNRLAHAILAHCGAPGDRVAILMEHDAPAVATVVAVLKAGLVVVALNRTHPAEYLRQIIEDSEAGVIVTDSANRSLASTIAGPTRTVVSFEEASTGDPHHNPTVTISSDQIALLGYTSGSTGRPKAVMMRRKKPLSGQRLLAPSGADRTAVFGRTRR